MRKKVISTFLTVAMVAALLAGCGSTNGSKTNDTATENAEAVSESNESTQTASEVKTGGTLQVGTTQNPSVVGYTPELTNNSFIQFLRCSYESLLYYDEDGNVIGQLATDWTTDSDAATITFHLLEGVKFSDGTDFNADAVKWNIETYKEAGRSEVSYVDSVECEDDYTVKIQLTEWNSSALECIGFFVYYMSPTAYEKNGVDWMRQNSCGTGPYVVSSFDQGVSVKYVKNEDYHIEGEPYLDGINFSIMSDNTTLENALLAGEIDVITYGNDADLMNDFASKDGYTIQENHNGIGVESTGLIPSSANENSPFYDAKVRQAFCYAVDWDTIVSSLSYGLFTRTNQWAAPGAATYNTDLTGYNFDQDKAKELLAEAGYTDGFDTTLYTVSGGFYENVSTAVADYLAKVGINASVEIIDAAKANDYMTNGWDGIFWHWASIGPDLGLYMGRHLDENGAYYAKGIQHPEDCLKLLSDIRSATDNDTKVKLEWELQEKVYDEYALFGMPMYVNPVCHIKANYVEGDDFAKVHAASWSPATTWLNK